MPWERKYQESCIKYRNNCLILNKLLFLLSFSAHSPLNWDQILPHGMS